MGVIWVAIRDERGIYLNGPCHRQAMHSLQLQKVVAGLDAAGHVLQQTCLRAWQVLLGGVQLD